MEGTAVPILIGVAAGLLIAGAFYLTLVRPADRLRADKKYRNRADQLVALSSHYLLTPISIIQSALSSLEERDNTLSPVERRHLYDTIFQGQQRLWILAERFVIAGEIQDEKGLELSLKVADLSKVVSDSITAVDAFAREKKVIIAYHEQVDVNTWETHLDLRRLKQAFIAVLDNAVKFSQEGGPVEVSLASADGMYRIVVADAGIGMPKDLAEHLGQPLSRGTSMYNFDYEGIGLGLYIAREVLRSHGGSLYVESKVKQGTVVTIEFPTE